MDWGYVIVGGFTLLGVIITNFVSNSKTLYRIEQIEKRIERIEEKQDKQNSISERLLIVEQSLKAQWTRTDEIKEAVKRIEQKVFEKD